MEERRGTPKRPLGQILVEQRDRDLITTGQACLMFINQVQLDAIPAEVEASPPAFQRDLKEYLANLGIGSPEWSEQFLLGGLYYFPNVSPEESWALHEQIAKKNRITAEALWRYFKAENDAEA